MSFQNSGYWPVTILSFGGESASSTSRTGLSDASLRKGLRLLWLSTGVDDFVLANSKSTVEMLKKNGFSPVFKESACGHTWANWRDYLNELAPQLFQ